MVNCIRDNIWFYYHVKNFEVLTMLYSILISALSIEYNIINTSFIRKRATYTIDRIITFLLTNIYYLLYFNILICYIICYGRINH